MTLVFENGTVSCSDSRMRITIPIAVVLLALASVAATAQDPALVTKGQKLTVEHKCSMCHAIAGKGGKIGKPFDGVSERYDAAALKRTLTDPLKEFPDAKIKMPKVAWASGEIDAVVAYLQTLKGSPAK
jgi:cytochrome c2